MKPLDLTGLEDGPQAAGLNLEALDEPTSNKVGDGVAAAASGQFVPARFAAAVNPETPYPGVDRFGSQIGPARSLGTLGEAGRMLRESLPATMVLGRSENQRLQDLQAQGSAGLNPPALDYRGQRTDQAGNLLPSVAKPVEVTEDTGALPSLARGVVGLGKIGVGLGLQAQDIAGIKGGPLPGWAADLKAITDEMQPEVGEFKNIGRGFTADERGALARRGAAYLQEAVMENLPMMVPSLVSGALALVFGRNLIKAAAARAMEAAAADSAAREALNHAARNLGVQAAEKHFIKAAGKAAAERATLAAQVAGATAGSVALESGNIYADMAEEGHRGRTQALVAAGAAVPAGVLDTLGEVMALRRLQGAPLGSAVARLAEKALGKPMVERGVVKLGVAGVEQFIAEAPTEFLQEAIEQAAKVSQDPAAQGAFWSKWWDTAPQWREAGIKGGLGGLGIGVGSGAIGAVVTGRGGESSKVKDQQSRVAVESEAPTVEGVDYLPDPTGGGVDPVEEMLEEGKRQKAKGKSEVLPGPDYQPLEGQPWEEEGGSQKEEGGSGGGAGLDLSGLEAEPDERALDYGDGGTLPEVQPWPKLPEVGAVPGQEKPWQMTREEWDARLTPAARKVFGVANGGFQHRQFVLDAAINGLPIPERVRAQYPDLNERVDEWRREQAKAAEQRKEIERRAAEEGQRKQEAAQRQREAEAKRRQEEEGYRAQRMATRHTRTLKEYLSGHSPRRHPGKLLAAEHRAAVEEALRQGKAVPAGVLADYPDLVIPEPPTGGRNTGVQGQDVAPAATPGGDRTAPAVGEVGGKKEEGSGKAAESARIADGTKRIGDTATVPKQAAAATTKFNKFTEGLAPMQRKRVETVLNDSVSAEGMPYRRHELVERDVNEGARVVIAKDGSRRLQRPDGRFRTEAQISKTAMDYAVFLTKTEREQPGMLPKPISGTSAPPAAPTPAVAKPKAEKVDVDGLGELPEFAKAAGVKSWKHAQKLGLQTIIKNALGIAEDVVRSAANWIYGSVAAAEQYLAREIVERVKVTGGRQTALNSLANDYYRKADGATEPGQRERFKATADALQRLSSYEQPKPVTPAVPAPPVAKPAPAAPTPAAATPAVKAEVRKAEVVKEKQAVAPLAAKAQKKFLLEEIDKALAEAPDVEVTPYPEMAYHGNEHRDRLEREYAAALAADKVRVGTVTIEVPGDGTFEILNTRKALQAFKAKAAKFPTTVPKKAEPGKVRETPTAAPVVGKLEPGAALKAARLAVSEDTGREVINHVWSDGQQSVGTDGRRMMIVQAGNGGTAKAPVLVRADGKTEPAKDRALNAKGEAQQDFPAWRQVVPKESMERGKGLDTGRLWTVLKQALAVWIGHEETEHSVTLVHNRDGSIGLMTSAPEAGEYVHNVQPGWQSITAVNGEYLADGLAGARMVGNEKVTISWSDEQAPVVIDGKGFKYVLMPMRLNGGRIEEVAKQEAERVAKMEELAGAARGEGKRQKAKGKSEESAAAERKNGIELQQEKMAQEEARLARISEEERAREAAQADMAWPVIEELRKVEGVRHGNSGIATDRGGQVWEKAVDGKFTQEQLNAAARWMVRNHAADSRIQRAVEGATAAAEKSVEEGFRDGYRQALKEASKDARSGLTGQTFGIEAVKKAEALGMSRATVYQDLVATGIRPEVVDVLLRGFQDKSGEVAEEGPRQKAKGERQKEGEEEGELESEISLRVERPSWVTIPAFEKKAKKYGKLLADTAALDADMRKRGFNPERDRDSERSRIESEYPEVLRTLKELYQEQGVVVPADSVLASGTDKLIAKLEGMKSSKHRGEVGAFNLPGISEAMWNTALDAGIGLLKAGRAIGEAIDAVVAKLRELGADFDEANVRQAVAIQLGEEPLREHAIKQLHAGNRNAAVQAAILAASTRDVRSDDEVDAAVAGIIREAGGAEAALPVVNDVRLPLDTRYALALAVANQLNDEVMRLTGQQPAGWLAESNRLAQLVGKFLGEFIPTTTETARGLRQLARLKAMGRQTPIGWDTFARTTIENVNAEQRARLAPTLQSLIEELNRLNAEVARATAETKAVQDAARQAAEAAVRAEAERQGSEIRNAMVIETTNGIELLPSVRKAKAAATVKALQKIGGAGYWQGLVNKGQAALVKAIEQALNGAGARVNAVTVAEIAQLMTRVLRQQVDATLGTAAQKRQGLPALMKLRVLFGANERMSDFWRGVRGQLANELTEKYGERPEIEALLAQTMDVWSGPLVRAAMKEVLAEQETNLGAVIREHLRGVGTGSIEAARATLAAKIVEAVGLDEQTGERLARAVEAEFDAEMRKQQGKVAERLRKAEENRRKAAAAVPTRKAEQIIKQLAKSQSDTLTWAQAKVDAVRAAVLEQLKTRGLADEDFKAKLVGLGVKPVAAGTLTQVVAREIEVRNRLAQELMFGEDAIDKAIRKALTATGQQLGRIVRTHHSEQAGVGKALAERLVAEAGLTGPAAERLAAAVLGRFKQLAEQRKRRIVEQMTKPRTARELRKRTVADRIIEASNLGALDAETTWKALAEKLGLAVYTPEHAAEVRRRAELLQRLPAGSVQRIQATARLLAFIAKAHGVKASELAWAVWYANMLAAWGTMTANAIGSVWTVAAAPWVAGRLNPKLAWIGGVEGLKGLVPGALEAAAILRYGSEAKRLKFDERQHALEQLTGKGFFGAQGLKQLRYVGRILAATDALFYMPAHEVRSAMIAHALAKEEGLSGAELARRRDEILHGTDRQEMDWRAQIDREALAVRDAGLEADRLWRARRLRQLRESNRSEAMQRSADSFALTTTYNNEPTGLIGAVAGAALYMRHRFPQTAFMVPFVNIVANVANESINYTPWGFARGLAGSRVGVGSVTAAWNEKMREGKTKLLPEEVLDLHVKAALGTLAVAAVAMAAAAGLGDDDKDAFQLYGAGPRRADGKIDGEKAKQLKETGWLPYSVRVGGRYYSFQTTPLVVPFGILGNYLDARRYQGEKWDQVGALDHAAFALWSGIHVVSAMSFIESVGRFFDWVSTGSALDKGGDALAREVGRTAGNMVFPRGLHELDRALDPTVYDGRGIGGALAAAVPFTRAANEKALGGLGTPVQRGVMDRFTNARIEGLMADLTDRNLWLGIPDRKEKMPLLERELNDKEWAQYVELYGTGRLRKDGREVALPNGGIAASLERYPQWRTLPREEAQARVNRIVAVAHYEARLALGWDLPVTLPNGKRPMIEGVDVPVNVLRK